MKTRRFILILLTLVCLCLFLASCTGKDSKKTKAQPLDSSPCSGETVALLEGDIYEWLTNYTEPGCSEPYIELETDKFAPKPLTIEWVPLEGAGYYIVTLSRKSDLSEAQTFVTFDNTCIVEDLFTGVSYYYTITACTDTEEVVSDLYDFKTAALPRTVSMGDVSNTRDMGGYLVNDGTQRIKQGIVYRGAELSGSAKVLEPIFIDRYGIKTEIDLRTGTEISVLRKYLNVVRIKAPYYLLINDSDYRADLLKEIQPFAVAENYPIYFHCSLGRDRTGTLALLLEAFLGVSEHDIYIDYEMSHFSRTGNPGDAGPKVTTGNLAATINYLKAYGSGTLAENTEQYLLDLGLTQEELNSIREIMLEEVE